MATITSAAEPLFYDDRLPGPIRGDVVLPSPILPPSPAQSAIDAQLVAIIDEPLPPGETTMAGYQRKEIKLVSMLCRLTVLESRSLHARLSNPIASDALAMKFMRLTIERRMRLLNFLADARRRAALERK